MILADAEVWQLATLLVKKFGPSAVDEAQQRAKQALEADDVMGQGLWLTVAWAVRELVRLARPEDLVN
jgi:triphosphoribosyl-dephospho-CoA synthetase